MKRLLLISSAVLVATALCIVGAPAWGNGTGTGGVTAVGGDRVLELGGSGDIIVLTEGETLTEPISATSVRVGDDGVIQLDGGRYIIVGGDEDQKDVKVKKSGKKRAFLGINMEELGEKPGTKYDYPRDSGVVITDVVDDSPAEKAGLEKHDIIYLFDGTKVEDPVHLSKMVRGKKPGDAVKIEFYRDGKKHEVNVELAEQSVEYYTVDWDDWSECAESMKDYARALSRSAGRLYGYGGRSRLGVRLAEINEDLAPYFDVKEGGGVLVIEVVEEGPAEKSGIKSGDVIVKVDGEEIHDSDDVHDAISSVRDDEKVEIEVIRRGARQSVTVELENVSGEHLYVFPPGRDLRIEIPDVDRLERHRPSILDKEMLRDEIKALKRQVKDLENRLKDLEKD